MADENFSKSIDTPRGRIEFKETTTGKTDFGDTVTELTADEVAQIKADAARAKSLVESHVTAKARTSDLLENLDLAFAAWLQSKDVNKEKPDEIVRIVGAAYGEFCVEKLGLRWAKVKDKLGEDYALVKDSPPTRSYPFTSVRYRIEDKKTDFIGALFETLKHTIESVKK